MDQPMISELFTRWDVPWLPTVGLVLVGLTYVTGWARARRTRPAELPPWRLAAFLSGLASIFVAISSPLDTFSESLLFMHMAQHFVLMSVAPPLLVLGAPVVPILRGTPRSVIRILEPVFRLRLVHALLRHPKRNLFAWLAMNVAYVGWHVPAAYEFALQSENWHNVEHACFLFTSLLFWWPVVRPWPSRQPQGSSRTGLRPWGGETKSQLPLIFYLVCADLVNTGVSAFLCFSGRLAYPSYADAQRPFPISALNDQIAAGSFMWVFGSMVFLVPVAVIIMRALSPRVLGLPDLLVSSNPDTQHARGEAV
jgi:cytochrome c oxidase assembly factor CtaG